MSKRTDLLLLLSDFKEHSATELEAVGGKGYRVIIRNIRKAGINVVCAGSHCYIPTGYFSAVVPLYKKWVGTPRGRKPGTSPRGVKGTKGKTRG